jgi:hypothetical protein
VAPSLARELLPRLARLCRKASDVDGAVWAWSQLIAMTGGLALGAYEELARLVERSRRDEEGALDWCRAGLASLSRGLGTLGGRIGLLAGRLRKRRDRLEKRLNRTRL